MATTGSVDAATTIETTPSKRKHVAEKPLTNGSSVSLDAQRQSDILEVLRQHDAISSLLDHDFKQAPEHTAKRAKLSNAATTSISAKLSKALYQSLEDLSKDAATVSDAIVSEARSKSKEEQQEGTKDAIEALKRVQRAQMMKQTVDELVQRELRHDNHAVKHELDFKAEIKTETEDAGTVLTLFGNAPGPKQLFSSLQGAASDGLTHQPALAIEELSLPNGLTTTKIRASSSTAEKPTTFGEAFAPAFALPPLSAPKPARRPSTRDKTIAWEFKDNTRGSKRGGYTTQSQSTADWLSYGGAAQASKERRRRTLSDGQASTNDEESAADLERQEEALFRQAYSSFAPAYDNSKAVVDVSLKNLVWWHKIGSRKYNARFSIDPALRELDDGSAVLEEEAVDDSGFAQAVEDYVEEFEEPVDMDKVDLTNTDEVLRRITSLLATLASQQFIRNSTPASTLGKPPISPAPSVQDQSDVPGKDEVDTYEQLQREIAYLVLQLPPYAVAKLDGNQLADLGVSKVITYEAKAYRGQMEEDLAARHTRQAAAAAREALSRTSAATSQQYSSSRSPAMGQPANTRYGLNTGFSRTPASAPAPQRSMTGQQTFGTPTAAPRQYTPSTAQYARSGAPQQSYGQANGQYQQRQGQSYSFNTTFSSTPNQRPVQSAGQSYPQRSQLAAANAVSYQTTPQPGFSKPDGRGTPVSYSPAQTPVNGVRAPPPLLARATSGTPQPNDVNGHS